MNIESLYNNFRTVIDRRRVQQDRSDLLFSIKHSEALEFCKGFAKDDSDVFFVLRNHVRNNEAHEVTKENSGNDAVRRQEFVERIRELLGEFADLDRNWLDDGL